MKKNNTQTTVSIADVAEKAGVSIATVSRVINGVANKASEKTTQKVREAINALGYRPSVAGRVLRQGKSRLVAILASNLTNPSMVAMAAGAERALRKAGYVMVLCDTHDSPSLQDQYLREMRAHYASAYVMLSAVASPLLEKFLEQNESLIFVNRKNPLGGATKTRFVGIDNVQAAKEVAAWMCAQQKRSLALIHGNTTSSATAERVLGFCQELARQGMALESQRIVGELSADHLQTGFFGMEELAKRGVIPDAVFCTSDLIAYGVHRWLLEQGPHLLPMSLVGFDDNPMNPWTSPWLNAVRVPYEAYGSAIIHVLSEEAGCEVILEHKLMIREHGLAIE